MNRIKTYRTKLGLTQRQLADRAKTSQQQIQRIESGTIAARLDLAGRICRALEQPMDKVFPKSAQALAKFSAELTAQPGYFPASDAYDRAAETGVELDGAAWRLRVLVRGHRAPIDYIVEPSEQRRLFSAVQGESSVATGCTFVVFDSSTHTVAIQLGQLVYCHFLFDSPDTVLVKREKKADHETDGVRAYFSGNTEAFEFDVSPDAGDPDDVDDWGDFKSILYTLELDPAASERLHFVDVDGEQVFLRAGDLALLEVPLWVTDPALLFDGEEDEVIEAVETAT